MRVALLPCPGCARHVKSGAPTCPFCDAPLHAAARPVDMPDTRGWKRAAVFTFGLAVGACSSTTSSTDAATVDTPADTARPDVASPDVAAPDVAAPDVPADLPRDEGGVAPPYGIAPPDAGIPDGAPADDGSIKADYGAPPPRDAGADR